MSKIVTIETDGALAGQTSPTVDGNLTVAGLLTAQAGVTVSAGPVTITPFALTEDSGGAGHLAWNAATATSVKHTLTKTTIQDLPSNMVEGMKLEARYQQAAGLYEVTFPAGFKWGAEGAPLFPSTSSGKAIRISWTAISATVLECTGFGVEIG